MKSGHFILEWRTEFVYGYWLNMTHKSHQYESRFRARTGYYIFIKDYKDFVFLEITHSDESHTMCWTCVKEHDFLELSNSKYT